MMAETLSVRLVISGRVQGVAYRAWTVQEARRRGLVGWVRNRRDGTVETLLHGAEHEVEMMVIACRRGPSLARVSEIARTPVEGPVADVAFVQLATVEGEPKPNET
jgi:acylphosphatase